MSKKFILKPKTGAKYRFGGLFSVRQHQKRDPCGPAKRLVRTKQKSRADESDENFRKKSKKKAPSAVTLETFDHLMWLNLQDSSQLCGKISRSITSEDVFLDGKEFEF